jgi:hypothetical protein
VKYTYTTVAGAETVAGKFVKRPVVEIEIAHKKQARKFLAVIDSGADNTLMPSYIADVLGIDYRGCPRYSVMGISMEPIEGFVADIDFLIHQQTERFTAPVVFIERNIPVLLGQEGFFDVHRIRFEKDHDIFEIIPTRRDS